jgi:arylsulfatase A-like enzyme
MQSRRDFLGKSGVLATSASLALAQLARPTGKPNVVILLASGLPDPALDDTDTLRIPQLARFAEQSVQFERSYVACPETGPSQAAILTGRFPFASGVPRDGVPLAADQLTITQKLREAGYQSAVIGDWRLGAPQKGPETELALEFIQQNRRNPFFLLLAWHRANAAVIDAAAGRVLRALTDLDDTIAVFTSAGGYGAGPLESAVRIPLMIRYPVRLKPGRRAGVLASHVDIAPTILALCGISSGDFTQGRDLTRELPQSIYCVGQLGTQAEWCMVVRGLDKLVADREQQVTKLYNLGADPLEMDNRAQDPALELRRNELKALLNDWMRRTGDGVDPSGLKRRAQAGLKRRARAEPPAAVPFRDSTAPTDHKLPTRCPREC